MHNLCRNEIFCVVQDKCLDWFPRLRAISLAVEDVDGEQNEWKTLQGQVTTNIKPAIYKK